MQRLAMRGPTFTASTARILSSAEPALESGDWIKRIRALRPNAATMEKEQLCQIGRSVISELETRQNSDGRWANSRAVIRISTLGRVLWDVGKPVSRRSRGAFVNHSGL